MGTPPPRASGMLPQTHMDGLATNRQLGFAARGAFFGSNAKGELMTSGFPLSGNSHRVGKGPHFGLQAMKPKLSACALSLLTKGDHTAHLRRSG